MATGGHVQRQPIAGASRLSLGATLVALSGLAQSAVPYLGYIAVPGTKAT